MRRAAVREEVENLHVGATGRYKVIEKDVDRRQYVLAMYGEGGDHMAYLIWPFDDAYVAEVDEHQGPAPTQAEASLYYPYARALLCVGNIDEEV